MNITFSQKLGKYPIDVIMYEQRANGFMPKRDKAKIVKDKAGSECIYLRKEKKALPLQNLEKQYSGTKFTLLNLVKYSETDIRAMSIKESKNITDPVFEAKEESVKFWAVVSHKDSRARWHKIPAWEKYLPAVMLICFGIGAFIVFKGLGDSIAQMEITASIISDMAKNVSQNQLDMLRLLKGVSVASGIAP